MTTAALTADAAIEDCRPVPVHAMGEPAAEALSATLKALADPRRLRMLSAIAVDPRGESCVCDLADLVDVSQPTVSHHLKVLKSVGVLQSERRGTWVWYRIAPELRAAVTGLLDTFAPAALHPPELPAEDPVAVTSSDDRIEDLADELAQRFPTLDATLVLTITRDSYTAMARTAGLTTRLLPLAEEFARQRLTDLSREPSHARPLVLFVCVANAGRSQLAAALTTQLSDGRVLARSAGSAPASDVHPHVRHLLAGIPAGHDAAGFPKPLTDDAVRAADVVVTMGCGDVCPVIPGTRYEDWAVGDPALASAEGAAAIRDDIAARVTQLLGSLLPDPDPDPAPAELEEPS